MTEIVICARCHGSFERVQTGTEAPAGLVSKVLAVQEREPVCEECEHEFLAWTCCPPIV